MADMNKAGTPKQAPIVPGFTPKQHVGVGGEILSAEPIEYNEGRYTAKIVVHNTGDRPIQVGSHFHFFEVNRYLEFDRAKAFGCHLNIPATTAIRFEPGDEKRLKSSLIPVNSMLWDSMGWYKDLPEMKMLRLIIRNGFRPSGMQKIWVLKS